MMSRPPLPIHQLLRMVASLALTLGLLAPCAASQTAPAPTASVSVPAAAPPLNGIAHVALRVKDIAVSVDFYHKLGFDQAFANKSAGGAITTSFIKINDRQFVELYPVTASDPASSFLHLCFGAADLKALGEYYAAQGLAPAAVRSGDDGNLLLTLKGPQQADAPQSIEFTQYLPGSQQTAALGKLLGPDRVGDKIILVALPMQNPAAARDFYLAKLGFMPSPGRVYRLELPGTSGESVEIVPSDALGTKASITFSATDLDKSAAQLQRQGVEFQRASEMVSGPGGQSTEIEMIGLSDPDGNVIRIQAVH